MSFSLDTAWALVLTGLTVFYAAVLLALRMGLRKLSEEIETRLLRSYDERLPAVSLVVAARNEAHNLPRLIQCLSNQEYPQSKLEIIIVDDR